MLSDQGLKSLRSRILEGQLQTEDCFLFQSSRPHLNPEGNESNSLKKRFVMNRFFAFLNSIFRATLPPHPRAWI